MAHRVCPWWLGYLLACPLRRVWHDPAKILAPHVRKGMTVLEPGPGMGFFTLELARLVGDTGRVVAVDIQSKMLDRLKRRAAKVQLSGRLEARLAQPDSMGIADLSGAVDFVLAFALVHEMPSAGTFFQEAARAMKPRAVLLFAEPAGHVKQEAFDAELKAAADAGLELRERLAMPRSHAAVLFKAR